MSKCKSLPKFIMTGIGCALLMSCSTTQIDGEPKREPTHEERARMFVDIGNAALVEGDATEALIQYARAEKEDASLPSLHHSKALAYNAKHDPVTAIAEARKAVQLKPDYSDASNTLGKLLMDSGQGDEAVTVLTRAANDPLYKDAYKPLTTLGVISYRRGEFQRADGYLSRAIEGAPSVACVAYYYRGHLRMREGRLTEATGDYDNAGKRTCAGFADAHLAMAIALERNKQFDLARKKYLEIQTRYPNTKIATQAMTHLRYLP